MSADIQREYHFDIVFATGSTMTFAEIDLSQSAFLNSCQRPWRESKSYNDFNSSLAVDAQLFASQPELPQPSVWSGGRE